MTSPQLKLMIMISFLIAVFYFIPPSDAHILVIGDSHSDIPFALENAKKAAKQLKSKGYKVLELYGSKATAKNILKGMYNADAIIYAGHGGYQTGNYKKNVASPPFSIMGSDDNIWGVGTNMREGYDFTRIFKPPVKSKIPVILINTCFSTGWVKTTEVANPIQTVYNFSRMFTGSGANFYATCFNSDIIEDFLNGAANFKEANDENGDDIPELAITKSTTYNGVKIWRNDHGKIAFVGDWNGKFPSASAITAYDNSAAESWYKSNRKSVIDILPLNINTPSKGALGKNIHITNSIKNRGVDSANKPFYAKYWLTKYKNSKETIYLGKTTVNSLAAGATNTKKTALKIPQNTKTGMYYIKTATDSSNQISEFDESNNVCYSSTRIYINKT